MFDNLRRTLSDARSYFTLVLGWAWPDSSPLLWTVFIFATIAIPTLIPSLAGITPRTEGASKRSHARAVARISGFRFIKRCSRSPCSRIRRGR